VRRSEVTRPALVKRSAVVGPAHAPDSGSFETLHAVHARLGHVKGRARRPPHHDDAHARPVHTVTRCVVLQTSQDTHLGVHSGNVDRGAQQRVSVIRRRDVVVNRSAYTLLVELVCDVYRRLLGPHVIICVLQCVKIWWVQNAKGSCQNVTSGNTSTQCHTGSVVCVCMTTTFFQSSSAHNADSTYT
jgi:hypothetical protein